MQLDGIVRSLYCEAVFVAWFGPDIVPEFATIAGLDGGSQPGNAAPCAPLPVLRAPPTRAAHRAVVLTR